MKDRRFNTGDPLMDAALAADDAKLEALGAYDDEDDEEYDGDGWCVECGDEFHLDDCGGYNPPCSCGLHCRSCHEAEMQDDSAPQVESPFIAPRDAE